MEYRTIYTLQVFKPDGGVITLTDKDYNYIRQISRRHSANRRQIVAVKQRKETSRVTVFNPFEHSAIKGYATSETWVSVSREVVDKFRCV